MEQFVRMILSVAVLPFLTANLLGAFGDASTNFGFVTIRDLIFFDYDRRACPPSVGPTNISVGLVPLYVEKISEAEGQFTVLCGIDLYWFDKRLSWNPEDFDGKASILLEFEEIWAPEVRFTLAPKDRTDLKERSPIRVFSDGLVHVVDYRMVTRVARFRAELFPFDSQRLVVGFAQTSASVEEVDLVLAAQNYSEIRQNTILPPDWHLTGVDCKRYQYRGMNELRPQEYAAAYCFMHISRDPSFIIANFCIPCFVVTLLAVLAIHSAETANGPRTAKYELGLVSLMSVSVLTLSLTDTLPRSGTMSRLHILYYGMVLAIFTSGIVSWLAVVVEKHYTDKRDSYKHKKWVLLAIDGISALLHVIFLMVLMLWFLYIK